MVSSINHSFEKFLELAVSDIERDAKLRAEVPSQPPPVAKPASDRVRSVPLPAGSEIPAQAPMNSDGLPVRPRHRPPVPVLTVLDDGSLATGQEIRIRSNSFVIGRTAGDFLIPNDTTLSGRHAEISLVSHGEQNVWTLTDLGSSNRTFVRVQAATLLPDVAVLIGSRRFQLQPAASEAIAIAPGRPNVTCQIPQQPPVDHCLDSLVELPDGPARARFPLSPPHVLIGRDGSRCGIHINDPTLAGIHAELMLRPDGLWVVRARPSRNGVWVSTQSVRLTNGCLFQCGEQRFRFSLP
jgi:pSer/pThr/pTyr-binding forkhead associated (FHA) protein